MSTEKNDEDISFRTEEEARAWDKFASDAPYSDATLAASYADRLLVERRKRFRPVDPFRGGK